MVCSACGGGSVWQCVVAAGRERHAPQQCRQCPDRNNQGGRKEEALGVGRVLL